jgi:hypothetical protein
VDLLIKDHLTGGQFGPVRWDLAFIANRNTERLFCRPGVIRHKGIASQRLDADVEALLKKAGFI